MKNTNYLSSLTSLRGIAALLVVLFHVNVVAFALAPDDSLLFHFLSRGYLWVDFFFLLSGFIMMHVYSEMFKGGIRINFKKFMRSRFARIYPLHLFSLLCMVLIYFWYKANYALEGYDNYIFDFKAFWTNLFLLQSMDLHKGLSWDSPAWSISVEWWMYVIFPFLLIPFRKITDWKKIFIFLGVVAGYLSIIYYFRPLSTALSTYPDPDMKNTLDVTYDYGFIRCFCGFLFGMLLYELYRIEWARRHLKKDVVWILTMGLIIALLTLALPDFIPVIFFGIIILVSVYSEGIGSKILNLKPLIYLGDISYSLYLMHIPLMFFIMAYLRKYPNIVLNSNYYTAWFWALMFLALVIMVSSLTYRFVEMPLRQKISRKKSNS